METISVGRIVLYRARTDDQMGINHNGVREGELLPAIVVRVFDESAYSPA